MTSILNEDTPEVVLRSFFKVYDVDKNGKLNKQEFSQFLSKLGLNNEELVAQALQSLADDDNDGEVDFEEFCAWIKTDHIKKIVLNEEQFEFFCTIAELFTRYDADGDGQISWDEWKQFFVENGQTEDEATNMWYSADINGDSRITMDEFWHSINGDVDENTNTNTNTNTNNNNNTMPAIKNKYMFVVIQFNAQFETSDAQTTNWTKCKYGSVSKSIAEETVVERLESLCGKKPKKRMEGEFKMDNAKFLYACDRKPYPYMFAVRGDTNFDEVKLLLTDLENIHRSLLSGVSSVASVDFNKHFRMLTDHIDNKTISYI